MGRRSTAVSTPDDGRTAAEDHREPVWRAKSTRDAGVARLGRVPLSSDAEIESWRGRGAARWRPRRWGSSRARLRAQRYTFTGSARRAIAVVDAWSARSRTAATVQTAGGRGGISAAQPREHPSLRCLQCVYRPGSMRLVYRAPTSGRMAIRLTTRRSPSSITSAASGSRRRALPRYRLWGALLIRRRRGVVSRRRHAVAEPVRLRARASRRSRSRGAREGRARDYLDPPEDALYWQGRVSVGMFEHVGVALPKVLRQDTSGPKTGGRAEP
jgi:hypothetical protein